MSQTKYLPEQQLIELLQREYTKENESCEWKEFKNLKHHISGHSGDDLVSYVSAISNMEGGCVVIGVADKTLAIVGIEQFHTYNTDNLCLMLLEQCVNLPSEGLFTKVSHLK